MEVWWFMVPPRETWETLESALSGFPIFLQGGEDATTLRPGAARRAVNLWSEAAIFWSCGSWKMGSMVLDIKSPERAGCTTTQLSSPHQTYLNKHTSIPSCFLPPKNPAVVKDRKSSSNHHKKRADWKIHRGTDRPPQQAARWHLPGTACGCGSSHLMNGMNSDEFQRLRLGLSTNAMRDCFSWFLTAHFDVIIVQAIHRLSIDYPYTNHRYTIDIPTSHEFSIRINPLTFVCRNNSPPSSATSYVRPPSWGVERFLILKSVELKLQQFQRIHSLNIFRMWDFPMIPHWLVQLHRIFQVKPSRGKAAASTTAPRASKTIETHFSDDKRWCCHHDFLFFSPWVAQVYVFFSSSSPAPNVNRFDKVAVTQIVSIFAHLGRIYPIFFLRVPCPTLHLSTGIKSGMWNDDYASGISGHCRFSCVWTLGIAIPWGGDILTMAFTCVGDVWAPNVMWPCGEMVNWCAISWNRNSSTFYILIILQSLQLRSQVEQFS